MNASTQLKTAWVVLFISSLACQTILGPDGPSQLVNTDLIKASPTPLPTPTPMPAPPSSRLSGEDLPLLIFGPPGDSPRDSDRPQLSGTPQTLDTTHFRVHYTLTGQDAAPEEDSDGNGHPDFVEEVAKALEFSWYAQVEYFAWTAPPPDALGGDERYDVYLEDILDDHISGYTDGDYDSNPRSDNPNSERIERFAMASYFAIDNDYSEYGGNRILGVSLLEYMRVTVAHEFNHAIQFGYDGIEPHDWLWEATATWMQDEVFDSINEGTSILPGEFKAPDSCQIDPGGENRVEDEDHWYAEWVFIRYLSERFGHEAVRELWDTVIDYDRYGVWDALLESKGTNFNVFFEDYSVALLTRDFHEGADYPLIRLEGEASIGETFDPVDGVAQVAADYVEILGSGVVTVTLETEGMGLLGVGIRASEAFLFSAVDGAVTFDTAGFEHSYVIVMNLERAHTSANCHFSDYRLLLEESGEPQIPFQVLPAPNFTPPSVDGLLDPEQFEE